MPSLLGPMVPPQPEEPKTPAKWDWRIVLVWTAWIVFGLGFELATAFDGSDASPPLTWVLIRYVPEVLTIGGIAWALYHFGVEYRRGKDGRW